jgi:uncharacterized membrane protein
MQPVRLVVGVLLVLAGCVWIGQGVGLIRGSSFMVDDMRWALIGAIVALVGLGITWSGRRRATSGP